MSKKDAELAADQKRVEGAREAAAQFKEENRQMIEEWQLQAAVAKEKGAAIAAASNATMESLLKDGKSEADAWVIEQEKKTESVRKAAKEQLAEWKAERAEELRNALETSRKQAEAQLSGIGNRGGIGGLEQKKAILDAQYNMDRESILRTISELNPTEVEAAKKLSDQLLQIWETLQDKKAALDEKYRDSLERSFQSIIAGPVHHFVEEAITGQETIGLAFQRLGGEMVVNLLESLAKMGLAWAEHWALVELETALGISTVGQMNALANIKTILNNAYVAASNAYADVPFPFNLVVAPAVFAAVAALGGGVSSAAGGMIVPNDMLAMVHQNEVVLPASISKKFLDSAPGGGSGGDVHVHFAVNAMDGKDVQSFFDQHGDKLARTMSRTLRNKGITRK